ncbi:MAG: AsmA family protein [Cellvibrio sp.]
MKRLSQVLVSLIVLVVLLLTLVVLFVSPNQFRPVLINLAKEQGIALELGNMGWTFWPRMGISLADVSIAPLNSPEVPLAKFSDAGLMLAIKPLLAGDFEVDYVRLENANIHLIRDKNGRGNWEDLIKSSEQPLDNSTAHDSQAKPLQLAIDRISLNEATIIFEDQLVGARYAIDRLNFDALEVNTQGRAFPMNLSLAASMRDEKSLRAQTLNLDLSHEVSINSDFSQLKLTKGKIAIKVADKTSAEADLGYEFEIKNLLGDLNYAGKIHLNNINARHWSNTLGLDLEMADAKALNVVELSGDLSGDANNLKLSKLDMRLDDSRIEGEFSVDNFSSPAITTRLALNHINVDRYLPPVTETAPTAETQSEDTPLPLDALQDIHVNANLTIGEVIVKKLTFSDADLSLSLNKGKWKQTFSTQAYQGNIQLNSQGNFLPARADLKFDGGVDKIEIAPVMEAQSLDEKFKLSGALNTRFDGKVTGATVNQLFDSLDMKATFDGAAVRLSPLNIEQRVCQAVNLIAEQKLHQVNWDEFTEMRSLEGELVWKNRVINLTKVNAGVSQLNVSAVGSIDLAKAIYNIGLPISILSASETAVASNCSLSTELAWLNRGLTLLRCVGDLNTLDLVKDCGPDKAALAELTRDYAAFKLKEKHGDKITAAEEKLDAEKQKFNEKVSEKLGLEADEDVTVQSALTGLLKKKLSERQSDSSASQASDSNTSSSSSQSEESQSNE